MIGLRFLKGKMLIILSIQIDINNIAILNIHGIDYRCIIFEVSNIKVIKRIRNYVLDDKGYYEMDELLKICIKDCTKY